MPNVTQNLTNVEHHARDARTTEIRVDVAFRRHLGCYWIAFDHLDDP